MNWDVLNIIIKAIELVILPLVGLVYWNMDKRIKRVEDKADAQPGICKFHDETCKLQISTTVEDRLRLVQRDIDFHDLRIEKLENRDKEIQEMKIQIATILTKVEYIIERLPS